MLASMHEWSNSNSTSLCKIPPETKAQPNADVADCVKSATETAETKAHARSPPNRLSKTAAQIKDKTKTKAAIRSKTALAKSAPVDTNASSQPNTHKESKDVATEQKHLHKEKDQQSMNMNKEPQEANELNDKQKEELVLNDKPEEEEKEKEKAT